MVQVAVENLYKRILADPQLSLFFKNSRIDHLKQMMVGQVSRLLPAIVLLFHYLASSCTLFF